MSGTCNPRGYHQRCPEAGIGHAVQSGLFNYKICVINYTDMVEGTRNLNSIVIIAADHPDSGPCDKGIKPQISSYFRCRYLLIGIDVIRFDASDFYDHDRNGTAK